MEFSAYDRSDYIENEPEMATVINMVKTRVDNPSTEDNEGIKSILYAPFDKYEKIASKSDYCYWQGDETP